MFGNALGWCISAVIAAATMGGLVWFQRHIADTTPTTVFVQDQSHLAKIELPMNPSSVLPRREVCDAGELYREAIDLYQQAPDAYDRFLAVAAASDEASHLAALEPLLKAINCSRMSLFGAEPQAVITYGDRPRLAAIRAVGQVANRMGLLLALENRPDEALEHHRAAFALGAHLYEERVVLEELLAGLELMSEASAALSAPSAKVSPSESQRFADFRAQYLKYFNDRVVPVQRVVTTIDPAVIARHAGDVFFLARNSQERMWRVEAILKLGRYRFFATRIADQQAATRALENLQTDADPLIRAAAKAAQGLTVEQYRMMR